MSSFAIDLPVKLVLVLTIMNIIYVKTLDEINAVRRLFREYEAYLNVDLCFQQFESELANLPGKYALPYGTLLLATDGQRAIGCGALRSLGAIQDRTCEMKRLYVCPENRGLGIGGKIARCLIQEGICLDYSTMVLDTLGRLKAAIHLYESLGFVRTEPYYDNPLPDVLYWKLDLRSQFE
jgi:ribosomal protein S18 acetylase RimI-like enzyme